MDMGSVGRLDIFIAPMFGGKTASLLRKLTQMREIGFNVLYINHCLDNRSTEGWSTHCPVLKNNKLDIQTLKTNDLQTVEKSQLTDFDVIGIDEAQFFDSYLIDFVKDLVDVQCKYVIVAGLDGDYKRQKFGYILDLIPIADNVAKLHAYCKICSREKKTVAALFTQYIGDEIAGNILIGGADKYIPVCRKCHSLFKN